MQKIARISAVDRITERSFGTTSRIELSLEPLIEQEAITSQSAMRWERRKAFFSSIVSGTGTSRTPARVFQKRFCG